MANRSWDEVKSTFTSGDIVVVRVVDRKPFGLLVELENNVGGVIERIGMAKEGYSVEEFSIDSMIEATITGFRDWSKQVELRIQARILKNG